ncbi:Uncharacterized mitochondrial protein AtMg00310 [Linum grandiflorum]
MSVFKIPDGILEDIHSVIMNIWWGQQRAERRIHWIRREEMTCPKEEGGMGFRDLCGFNTALLANQLWRLQANPESLIGRILIAKYYKNSTAFEA